MPELPEVETTRRGITPHVLNQTIQQVIVRNPRLRWPIPNDLAQILHKQKIKKITRRGKYLLLHCDKGCLIIHLGMSGKLSITENTHAADKHDHCEIIFSHHKTLRFNDPRRFGAILWTTIHPHKHTLLKDLGPEPLLKNFNGDYLYQCIQNKNMAIKQLIMDGKIVVGVGNIYASEALFLAKILPTRAAQTLALGECNTLVAAIKKILTQAIKAGGTTLKDFLQANGKPGYFSQKLLVYQRADQPCRDCGKAIRSIRLGQRATYFCLQCQK